MLDMWTAFVLVCAIVGGIVRETAGGLGDGWQCVVVGGGEAKRDLRSDCLHEVSRPYRDLSVTELR
jgi:hypothetical protein